MTTEVGGRRRWRLLSIVAVANLAMVGLAAAPSQAQGVSLCSGTAEGFTIAGDLAVPAGASCTLIDSTVRGNVVVRDDANLSLDGSTIRGNLTVRTNGFVGATGSSVGGVTALREAFGAAVEQSELSGGVNARESGFFFSDGTTHGVRVVSNASQTVILSGWVSGDVRTTLDLLTDVRDSVVTGGYTVDQAELGSVVCRSEIDGNVAVSGSGDLIQLGGSAPVTDCEFNVFGGSVTVTDNTADIRISDNVIRGDLACAGNDPAPTGSGNRIRGEATGQCADLAPAVAAFGASPSERLTADSRIAELTLDIELRQAAATIEATAAGPAEL
jgi:hypothetical protein